MHTRLLLALVGLVGLAACDESFGNGACVEDSDCPTGQTCLVDLTRQTSYCTAIGCDSDADCETFQTCRASVGGTLQVCVDRLRECGETEVCNGLDDDCDGVVDGAACTLLERCLDDEPCGAWVCQAPENQPTAVCAPPDAAAKSDYAPCTTDAECSNGVCETGFCSEMCRPRDTRGCPTIFVDGREYETFCARSVGDVSRPKHNKCQIDCTTNRDCPDNLTCVWRDVFQGGENHHFVCAIPNPDLKPNGAECTNNEPDGGDAECQSGLCFGRVCTRSCGGPGSDCRDIGANHVCRDVDLLYGELTFGAFVCVDGDS